MIVLPVIVLLFAEESNVSALFPVAPPMSKKLLLFIILLLAETKLTPSLVFVMLLPVTVTYLVLAPEILIPVSIPAVFEVLEIVLPLIVLLLPPAVKNIPIPQYELLPEL